ncbi:hypothetical protein ACFXD5_12180 [Streptomyces sp. NPDC059385]|uniref:hypothetical protein n=1 Tax=Streptomyces sp. NPDC059385 TaxID=3346817 RepID=UPI00367F6018
MSDIIAGSPAPTNPTCGAPLYTAAEAAQLMTPAKRLLAALAARAAAPRILDIHLDDCEDDRCEGCEPQYLAEISATSRTARKELLLLDASGEWPAYVDRILTKHRAEVLQAGADWLMSQGHTIAARDLDGYTEGGAR